VVPVIDVERFDLSDGEQVALVGSSGSGKTTLLHLIAGILASDSGKILFGPSSLLPVDGPVFSAQAVADDQGDGQKLEYRSAPTAGRSKKGQDLLPPGVVDLSQLPEADRDVFRGRNIGYIFQTHHLLSGFTAMENVQLGMSFTGRSPDPAWAKHLLDEVGLAERLHYKPSRLSVGQQQRVAIARALANRPKLVLADEPTGALDVVNAQQALDLIRKLCSEVGSMLLIVSHDPQITRQLPRAVELSALNRASTTVMA
jgi:putative ABC transport system ATP-binding protein